MHPPNPSPLFLKHQINNSTSHLGHNHILRCTLDSCRHPQNRLSQASKKLLDAHTLFADCMQSTWCRVTHIYSWYVMFASIMFSSPGIVLCSRNVQRYRWDAEKRHRAQQRIQVKDLEMDCGLEIPRRKKWREKQHTLSMVSVRLKDLLRPHMFVYM